MSAITKFASKFRVSGVSCGIKKKPGSLDLALITSDLPCTAAGVFTQNRFRAAPVLVCENVLQNTKTVNSVVINSGCANACTGDRGLKDAKSMSEFCGGKTQLTVDSNCDNKALVMSTGVIGQFLNMDNIKNGIESAYKELGNNEENWKNCAKAIMTTDTFHKYISSSFKIHGVKQDITITGISKGVGMIHPNMATMLCILATDANITQPLLQKSVKFAADRSFNCISVDGDTSTNDSMLVLANGAAMLGNEANDNEINIIDNENSTAFLEFQTQLTSLSINLAKMLIRDGEGATKFIEIEVTGAKSFLQGKAIASTIATSNLVKTAIFGKDANWGRIICALGYSPELVSFDTGEVNLFISSKDKNGNTVDCLHLFKDGAPYEIDEERAAVILNETDIFLKLQIAKDENNLSESVKFWTSDLSYDYVKINADYRT